MENAESKASRARGIQGCSDQHPNHPYSQKGIRDDGRQSGDITIRNDGKTRKGASLAGGILARLIEDAASRLNEARECIAWYQREEAKQLARLKDLEELKALESDVDHPQS